MKSRIAYVLIPAIVFTLATPKRAHSGVLEGALIGGAIGAVIGIIIEASKPKEPKPIAPNTDSLRTVNPDSGSNSNMIHK